MRKRRDKLKFAMIQKAGTLIDFSFMVEINYHRLSKFVSGSIEIGQEEHQKIQKGLHLTNRQYQRLLQP